MKFQLRRILAIGLAFLGACTPQSPEPESPIRQGFVSQALTTPKERVLAVPKWVGIIKARSRSSGTSTSVDNTSTWSASLTYTAPVELYMQPSSNSGFALITSAGFTFKKDDRLFFKGDPSTIQTGSCSDTTPFAVEFLSFPTDSTYTFAPKAFANTICFGTIAFVPSPPATYGMQWFQLPPSAESLFTLSLPALDAPLRLHGSRHFISDGNTIISSIPDPIPYGSKPVEWDVEWDLRPESTELDLVLSAEDYDNWLPLAHIEPVVGTSLTAGTMQPGSTIRVKAQPIPKPGSTSTPKMKQITFILKFSSNEPGIAMNALDGSPTPDGKDLQFEQDKNTALGLEFVDIATVKTPVGEYEDAKAVISSFDFGGYGEVIALGETEDGKAVISVIEDLPSVPGDPPTLSNGPLRLPKRAPDSHIATQWKTTENSLSKTDLDDSETLGNGRGDVNKPGDGLSHYEEYRGFILKNAHTRTKPSDVDYFLNNKMGSDADEGINLFRTLTGIKVHLVDELDFESPSRVINPYYLKATHVTDQHVVIMFKVPGEKGTSNTLPSGAGNPKKVERIEIASGTPQAGLKTAIAHELAHSVNVPHHGEWGFFVAAWEELGNSQFREAPKYPLGLAEGMVDTYLETPSLTPAVDSDENLPRFLVSTKCKEDGTQSVFSGAHNCIMRYRAEVKIHTENTNELHRRAFLTDEAYGTTLCDTTQGTGFNAPPNPRHSGPAASGRGDCIHKIVVSDRYDLAPWTRRATCDPIRAYRTLPPKLQAQADSEK